MTTIPSRLNISKYAIESILDQTYRVDEIRIYIPYVSYKGEKYKIPKWMKDLEKTIKQFVIKRCDKDWGPATKIIPAILDSRTEHIDCIIYIDDDVIYNKNAIETLISYSKRFPKYVIANQGWNIDRWNCNKLDNFLYHFKRYFPVIDPYNYEFKDVIQGFSAVLVKPEFFDISSLIHTEKYPKEVFFVDDVYISGMLNKNGIKRISTKIHIGVPYWHEFFYGCFLKKASNSLSSEQNKDSVNDMIASKCFNWIKQIDIKIPKTKF